MLRIVLASLVLAMASAVVVAEVIELEGTIKSIAADARSIAITRQTPKGEKVLELEIAKNAGDLSGLKAGDRISFAYNPDAEIVTKIEKGLSEEAAADLKKFQGEWKNTLTEEAGNRLEPAEQRRENRTLFVKGNNFRMERVKGGKFGFHEGTFRLDADKHFFDMQEPGGLTYIGIYEVGKDTLKLCYRLYQQSGPPPARPTEFKTSADKPAVYNYEYKKVSNETAKASHLGAVGDDDSARTFLDKMLTAVEKNDYDRFVADTSASYKATLTKEIVAKISEQLAPRMKKGYDVLFLGQWKRRGHTIYLWKLTFTDSGDDLAVTLSLKDGEVCGSLWQL